MIELHLIEDKIYYGVVEEFLFLKIYKNAKNNLFHDCGLTKFRDNKLISCLTYMRDHLDKLQKSIVIKYQATDREQYKQIIKIYTRDEVEKYFLLF